MLFGQDQLPLARETQDVKMVAMPNQQAVAAAQQGSTVYFERLPQGWVWASLSDRGRAVFLWHRFGSWWGRWPESSHMDAKVNTNHSHYNTQTRAGERGWPTLSGAIQGVGSGATVAAFETESGVAGWQ